MGKIVKRNKKNNVRFDYEGPKPDDAKHPAQYTITHVPSGRYYVGSTGNMQQRRWAQMKDLNSGKHSNPEFRDLYEPGDELVFVIHPVSTRDEAYELEQNKLNAEWGNPLLLNKLEDVRGYALGHEHSPEVLEKLASKRGEDHHMFGVKFTEEHRRKIGDAHKGKVVSDETRLRISRSKKGQNAGEKSILANPVCIDGKNYGTIDEASRAVGLSTLTVRRRLDDERYPEWVRTKPKRGHPQ